MQPIKLGAGRIYFGSGSLSFLKDSLKSDDRVLIVQNGYILKEIGAEEKLLQYLITQEVCFFYNVEPEPSYENIVEGTSLASAFKPTVIIGFGGGSAMDAAKLIWACYENPHLDTLEKLVKPGAITTLREKAVLYCISTTSGTGSEVTRAAVVTDTKNKKKFAVVEKNLGLVPDVALLDATLTESMPKHLIAATGMDAITHAIESYISLKANTFSDAVAFSAFKIAYENLEEAYKTKNIDSLSNMQAASSLAGIAFSNSGLGIVHSIAHTVGAKYHIPHGLANAIILPYVLRYLMKDKNIEKKLAALAYVIRKDDIIRAIEDVNKRLQIPTSLRLVSKDFKEEDIDMLAEISLSDINTNNSPIRPTFSEMKEIITGAFTVS